MPEIRPTTGSKGGVSGAVLAGVLLVPATAIAAVAIVGATTRPPAAVAADTTSTTTSTTMAEETTTSVPEPAIDDLSDEQAIQEACTEGAVELVDKELNESLTDIETAALDALRAICADHGLEVAGPPAPEDVVRVVTVKSPAATTTSTTAAGDDGTDSADEHYEDDHDDDHDEDHEDEDHEDEDHEDEDEDHEDDD